MAIEVVPTSRPWLVEVRFHYDPDFISAIKEVPTSSWDPQKKTWTFQSQWTETFIERCSRYLDLVEIATIRSLSSPVPPPGIEAPIVNGSLYPFQKDAFRFLAHRQDAIISLDVGLGKTFTALSYILWLRKNNRIDFALVVAPKSILPHWEQTVKDYFSSLSCIIINGNRRERRVRWGVNSDVYILNYAILQDTLDLKETWKGKTFALVADEVTRIKSHRAMRTKLMFQLPAEYRIGLTGRVIENNLSELYTIADWVRPRFFGTWRNFEDQHIDRDRFGGVRSYRNLDSIRKMLPYVMFRVTKRQAMPHLPPVVEMTYKVQMSSEESSEYNQIKQKIDDEIKQGVKGASVLSWLTMARMYCDHPALVAMSTSDTAKLVSVKCKSSSKMEELKSVLDEIESKSILIFTQYSTMAERLAVELGERKPLLVTGEVSSKDQEDRIKQFMEGDRMLISTDVFAYGINLQKADYIIHYDLPWNPAIFDQRIGRAHRIGRTAQVTSISLVVEDFDKVERRVREVLGQKEQLQKDLLEAVG